MVERAKITSAHMIVYVRLDGQANIAKIENGVNQTRVRTPELAYRRPVGTSAFAMDTKGKIVIKLTRVDPTRANTTAVVAISTVIHRANVISAIQATSAKLTTVKIVTAMLNV